eukprot:403351663
MLNKQEKYRINIPQIQESPTLELSNTSINNKQNSSFDKQMDEDFGEEVIHQIEKVELEKYISHQKAIGHSNLDKSKLEILSMHSINNFNGKEQQQYTKQETRALNHKSSNVLPKHIARRNHMKPYQGQQISKQNTNMEWGKILVQHEESKSPDTRKSGFFQQKNDNTIHFAYLYASPLVVDLGGETKDDVFAEIGFREEFDQIENALKDDNTQIRYRYQLATIQNLSECLRQQPLGLHFSGHGLQNQKEKLKNIAPMNFHRTIQNKGDILVFEETDGGIAQFLYQDELKKILFQYKSDLKFVVVASCHSEMCGEVFKASGAEHVICIQQDKEVKDRSAITFSRAFYINVFSSRMTICEAYQNAVFLVEKEFGKNEAAIFKLKTQDNHQCDETFALMDNLLPGKIIPIIKKPKLLIIPSNITKWISRNMETYEIIQKLLFDGAKIVEVFGFSGVGKSAIITKVAIYLSERHIYNGGIIYVNCSGFEKVKDAFAYLIQKLNIHVGKNAKKLASLRKLGEKDLLNKISQFTFSTQKVLFIFDNIEQIVYNDRVKMVNSFNQLVCDRDNLQILFSTSLYVGGLERFVVKNLKSLNPRKSAQLFLAKIPSQEAKNQLLNITMMGKLEKMTKEYENNSRAVALLKLNASQAENLMKLRFCEDRCKKGTHNNDIEKCVLAYFEKHPMFHILTEPLSLCLAASQLHYLNIAQLYEKILNSKFLEEKDDALLINIIHSIQVANQQYDYSTELLFIIGQTPQGLSFSDISIIFKGKTDIDQAIQFLLDTSLLEVDNQSQCYNVQNFVAKFIEQQLYEQKDMKIKYNIRLASFYIEIINMMKQEVSDDEKDLQSLIHEFIYYEKNILACMTYLLSICFPQDDQLKKNSQQLTGKLQVLVANNEISNQFMKQLTLEVKSKFENKKSKRSKRKLMNSVSHSDITYLNIAVDKVLQKFVSQKSIKEQQNDYDTLWIEQIEELKVGYNQKDQEKLNLKKIQSNMSSLKGMKSYLTSNYNSSDSSDELSDEEKSGSLNGQSITSPNNQSVNQNFHKNAFANKNEITEQKTENQPQENLRQMVPRVSIGNLDDFIYSSILKKLSLQQKHSFPLIDEEELLPDPNSLIPMRSYSSNDYMSKVTDDKNQVTQQIKKAFEQNLSNSRGNLKVDENEEQKIQTTLGTSNAGINSVLSQYIGHELKKMSDKVTDQEKAKYKKTLSKFKLFDKMIQVKPSEALAKFFSNQIKAWSNEDGVSKNQEKSIDTENIQINETSVANQIIMLRHQRLFQKTKQQKSQKSQNNINLDQTLGNLQSQISNNQLLSPKAAASSSQKENNQDSDENDHQLTDEELQHNMILGYCQTLLFHYLSIQTLNNTDPHELQKLNTKYHIDDMGPIFKSNIELLMVYSLLSRGKVESASVYLEGIAKTFREEKCIRGLGIFNFFMSYIFQNLKVRNHTQMMKTCLKASNYLQKGVLYFKKCNDQQGICYCNNLRKTIEIKINRGQVLLGDSKTNLENSMNASSQDDSPRSIRSEFEQISDSSFQFSKLRSMMTIGIENQINEQEISRFELVKDEPSLNLLLNLVSIGGSQSNKINLNKFHSEYFKSAPVSPRNSMLRLNLEKI